MNIDQGKYYCVILTEEPLLSFNLFAIDEEDVYEYVRSNFESNFYFVSLKDLNGNEEGLKDIAKFGKKELDNEIKSIDNIFDFFTLNAKEGRIYTTERFNKDQS